MKTIKIATVAALLMFAFGTNAQAGSTCYYNAYGQIVCKSDGRTETWTDQGYGMTNQDARGNIQKVCRWNAYGQYVCN